MQMDRVIAEGRRCRGTAGWSGGCFWPECFQELGWSSEASSVLLAAIVKGSVCWKWRGTESTEASHLEAAIGPKEKAGGPGPNR